MQSQTDKALAKAKWAKANPEKRKEYQKRYQQKKRDSQTPEETQERIASIRRLRYKRRFGITPEEYDSQLAKQGGVCAVCSKAETYTDPRMVGPKRLAVDHDPKTGLLRGLLCTACNTAIGKLGDSEEGVLRAVAYLQNPPWGKEP